MRSFPKVTDPQVARKGSMCRGPDERYHPRRRRDLIDAFAACRKVLQIRLRGVERTVLPAEVDNRWQVPPGSFFVSAEGDLPALIRCRRQDRSRVFTTGHKRLALYAAKKLNCKKKRETLTNLYRAPSDGRRRRPRNSVRGDGRPSIR